MLSGAGRRRNMRRGEANGKRRHDSIAVPGKEGRPPAVLQVIPSLVSGGVERGTVELAAALVAAGWTAYVASAGGPMERQLARIGAHHLQIAARVEEPAGHPAQCGGPPRHHPPASDRHRARAQPRAGVECVVGRPRDTPPLRDDVP